MNDKQRKSQGFHSINVPSEWGLLTQQTKETWLVIVSIQLMSPASGDLEDVERKKQHELDKVSIQLMSPASGDKYHEITKQDRFHICFHSINVPSEWGR